MIAPLFLILLPLLEWGEVFKVSAVGKGDLLMQGKLLGRVIYSGNVCLSVCLCLL